MSNTIRIYNRKNLKKTPRYNLDDPRFTSSLEKMSEMGLAISHQVGIPITYKSWICMGHCDCCKDHGLDQKRQRKIRKREFIRTLLSEMEE